MQVTKCDRCKAEIPNKVHRIRGEVVDMANKGDEIDSQTLKPKDLCSSCVAEIEVLIGMVLFEVRVYDYPLKTGVDQPSIEASGWNRSENTVLVRSHP